MNLVSNVNWYKISFSTLLRVVAAPHHKGFFGSGLTCLSERFEVLEDFLTLAMG